ncbi:MAG TPA: hypothetical protein VFO01_15780 [Trebonia sp.]|nr:hypothetical protein [Trebonia sp.]
MGAGADLLSLITRNIRDIQQIQLFLHMALMLMVMAPIMCAGGVIMALRVTSHAASPFGPDCAGPKPLPGGVAGKHDGAVSTAMTGVRERRGLTAPEVAASRRLPVCTRLASSGGSDPGRAPRRRGAQGNPRPPAARQFRSQLPRALMSPVTAPC